MSPAELLKGLDEGTLDPAQFRHADHVAAAWAALHEPNSAQRVREGLQRLSAKAGVPQRYDDALTLRFLRRIERRMARGQSYDEFCAANPDLFAKQRRNVPFELLKLSLSCVLGGLALHAMLRRESFAIAGVELCGALLLPWKPRAGAIVLGASLAAAVVVHRQLPIHFVVPAFALFFIAQRK